MRRISEWLPACRYAAASLMLLGSSVLATSGCLDGDDDDTVCGFASGPVSLEWEGERFALTESSASLTSEPGGQAQLVAALRLILESKQAGSQPFRLIVTCPSCGFAQGHDVTACKSDHTELNIQLLHEEPTGVLSETADYNYLAKCVRVRISSITADSVAGQFCTSRESDFLLKLPTGSFFAAVEATPAR